MNQATRKVVLCHLCVISYHVSLCVFLLFATFTSGDWVILPFFSHVFPIWLAGPHVSH